MNFYHCWISAPSIQPKTSSLLLCCKNGQTVLFLGNIANCTTLDVVMTACKLAHLPLTNIQVLFSTLRWEIQMKIHVSISVIGAWRHLTKDESRVPCVTVCDSCSVGRHAPGFGSSLGPLSFPQDSSFLTKQLERSLFSSGSWATSVTLRGPHPLLSPGHRPVSPTCSLLPLCLSNSQGKTLFRVPPQTWPASPGNGDLLKLQSLLPHYSCAWTDHWSQHEFLVHALCCQPSGLPSVSVYCSM